MKTIKFLLTTIAVLLGSVMANAYDFEVDGIRYDITSFTELTVKASSLSETFVGDLVIPSKVQFNGKELVITEVGDDFAISNTAITALTIQDGVKSVGARAFKNCSHIATVKISPTITLIGQECFCGCTDLKIFTHQGKITIGAKTFCDCRNLEQVVIENLDSLSEGTFKNCVKLSDCYVPNIVSIGKESFLNCASLINFNIPSSVRTIGDSAFEFCSNIISIIVPNNVNTLGLGAFNYCTSLVSISIGSGLTYLPWVFQGCTNLSDIRIEDAATTLTFGYTGKRTYTSNYSDQYIKERSSSYYPCSSMFDNYNIKNLYIGRNITTEAYHFKRYYQSGAYSIEDSYYVPNPPFSESCIENLTIGSLVSDLRMCPNIKTQVPTTFVIGSFAGAFQNCANLDSIILHSKATSIPENTFSGCNKINSLEIPNSVKEIGVNAFKNCNELKILTLGSNLETIGANALDSCNSLIEINLKSSIPPTYNTGFSSASYISTQINVPTDVFSVYQETEPWKNFWNLSKKDELISIFEVDGLIYSVIENKNVEIIGNRISQPIDLYINNKVDYYGNTYDIIAISNTAFKNCSYLSSVHIEKGIKKIGDSAFESCANLQMINIPSNLSVIGNAAFKNCSILEYIILPDSISTIPNECFYGCTFLDSVSIPSNVITIGKYAFYNCLFIEKLIIPSAVTEVGAYALKGCRNLRELIFEDGNVPLLLSHKGEYESGSGYIDANGKKIYIKYYNSYFSNIPIEVLYIGRNLSNESRYSISEKKWEDYYKFYYYVVNSYDAPFSNLSKLKELVIGENVDILGPEKEYISEFDLYVTPGSFKKCSSIQTVEVKNPIPPTGAEFSDAVYSKAHLTVPTESKSLYKEAIGWKDFVSLMKYKITYVVDDSIYFADTLLVGDTIILPATPIKEGYSFSGWSEIPETMPAEDIIVTGTFTINTYKITYIVDGEIYATDSVAYGTKIIAIEEPNKEGHTFNGWSEIPETMPANDITIVGAFKYAVTYMVNDEVYNTDSIVYGSEIVLIAEPTKEGYTFSGWSKVPETMPAEDIVIDGYFSVNYYAINYIVDNEPFATDSIAYGTIIELREEPIKEGYKFSGWSEAPETMPAHDVEIYGNFISTSITNVKVDSENRKKVIKDDQLFIILPNGKTYNAIGQEL